MKTLSLQKSHPFLFTLLSLPLFSLAYALLEQIAIPVPFSPVPVLLQPLPLFLFSYLFGWHAVAGFALYLFQGALGAPFFAFGMGGFARLMGPTGGYLFGMLAASAFLVATKNFVQRSRFFLLCALLFAQTIVYSFGLMQLSWYLPFESLFIAGFWPFMPGCFLKIGILLFIVKIKK